MLELEQNQFDHYTHPCVPTVYALEFLVAFIWCLCKKYESVKRSLVRYLCACAKPRGVEGMKRRVAVALSGGVDSLVAAILLRRSGE